MEASKSRPTALCLCVIRKRSAILVEEGYDSVKKEVYYRPLGGKIQFGEYGYQAAAREVKEEIGAYITNVRFLGTIESIFTHEGNREHEVILVYEADFVAESFYNKAKIVGVEKTPSTGEEGPVQIKALWKDIAYFKKGEAPLYPHGLIELMSGKKSKMS